MNKEPSFESETLELHTYKELTDVISQLVPESTAVEYESATESIEYPYYNGKIRSLNIEGNVADAIGFGDKVRAEIVGDNQTGVGIVVRPRNIFKNDKYGFIIVPMEESGPHGRSFGLLHGKISKLPDVLISPDDIAFDETFKKSYSLLPAEDPLSQGLMLSLLNAAKR